MTRTAHLTLHPTRLAGLSVVQRHPLGDARGYLERMFCAEEAASVMGGRQVMQVNHTLTARRGTVRGVHYQQAPHAEMKWVSCLRGEVFDVAVDIRPGSPTRLQWHAERLSADNHRTLLIPEGFAHGFQTLTDGCEMLYLHSALYAPQAEAGLDALDPALSINWPLQITERSFRDQQHPRISTSFTGVDV
jgi:dTDP-4-dehydrorhamnose 3,5-epimerase